jgi:hypothetical protein
MLEGPVKKKFAFTSALPGRSFCSSQLKAKIEYRSTQSRYLVFKLTDFAGEFTITKSQAWQ